MVVASPPPPPQPLLNLRIAWHLLGHGHGTSCSHGSDGWHDRIAVKAALQMSWEADGIGGSRLEVSAAFQKRKQMWNPEVPRVKDTRFTPGKIPTCSNHWSNGDSTTQLTLKPWTSLGPLAVSKYANPGPAFQRAFQRKPPALHHSFQKKCPKISEIAPYPYLGCSSSYKCGCLSTVSIHPSIYRSIYLPTYLPTYLASYLSIYVI